MAVLIMESGLKSSLKRNITTASASSKRGPVSTSWLKSLLSSSSESAENSPAKSEMPRRSVNFNFESGQSPEVSSCIKTFNSLGSNSPQKSTRLALQLARAKKSISISSWVSGLLSETSETPQKAIQKMVKDKSESLNKWVKEIVVLTDPPKDKKYKDKVKGAICQIVDKAFGDDVENDNKDTTNEEKETTPRFVHDVCLAELVQKRTSNKPKNLKQKVKLQRAQEAINAFPQLESSRIGTSSKRKYKRENPIFSEFGGATLAYSFPKQSRNIDFAHKQSPGPAQYNAHKTSLKSTPVAVFPTDRTTRDYYLEPVDTPGPAEYTPIKQFISK